MYLLVAATELEMAPVRAELSGTDGVDFLVSGVGPLETAVSLCCRLAGGGGVPSGVVNLGVAGAYPGSGAGMLDLCLADREIMGDLGICFSETIEPLAAGLVRSEFPLDAGFRGRAVEILAGAGVPFLTGPFVTVNSVSGTLQRGNFLHRTHAALCENMEGAAVARACEARGVACLELRCISNLVEDRQPAAWRLREAAAKAAQAAVLLVRGLVQGA